MTKTERDHLKTVASVMLTDPEDYSVQALVDVLIKADDEYHNNQESFIEDNEYDALRLIAERLDPTNAYFIGVGSDVRGGKVKLPFEMGSLNQSQVGEIEGWITSNKLQKELIIASDKMDGTSAMIIYGEDGKPQIAYSRGNGTEGADISRHIFKIKNVPKQVSGRMVIRAEVEMTESGFSKFKTVTTRHSSKESYKNARNAVAGCMNRKVNPEIVYEYLNVVAYEIIDFDGGKLEQLEALDAEGFAVVDYTLLKGSKITDKSLADLLNDRREKLDYQIDGLVLEVDSKKKRDEMTPTRDTLNPDYAVKYKVADANNIAIATVKGVTWNVSKHGFLKPQINIEPVELVGVTISNCTGFNAKFIHDNLIGAGAKIQLTRSGDVIPFCQKVLLGAKMASMPDEECHWNETGVDLVLKNKGDSEEVVINQLIDFFEKIEAPFLKEGNVRKLVAAGFYTPQLIIRDLSKRVMVDLLGENGKKVYDGLNTKLTNIPAYKLMGAFSKERGMGVRKFKKLQAAIGATNLINGTFSLKDVLGVDGFESKTAAKVILVSGEFIEFLNYIDGHYSFEVEKDTSGGSLVGEKVVMTGFRDADMIVGIEAAGGEVQSGVSGKTTLLVCKDPNSNSGKVKKAKDKGVKVISIDEMKGML